MPNAPRYSQLKSVGYRLIGPVATPAIMWIVEEIEAAKSNNPLFIGREGFFLRRLAEECRMRTHPGSTKHYRYLSVSRAFCFKLLLDRPELLSLALTHGYDGTLAGLLRDRFVLDSATIQQFNLPTHLPNITLPRDEAFVRAALLDLQPRLATMISAKRDLYLAYLAHLSPDPELTLIDIGFSGSIQKCLSAITGKPSVGRYFCVNHAISSRPPGVDIDISAKGYWTNDGRFGGGDPLVDMSLVMEALFTAPWGQLADIAPRPQATPPLTFHYKPHVRIGESFQHLYAVMDGAIDHLVDTVESGITAKDWSSHFNSRRIYELLLKFDRSEEMDYLRDLLEIDDSITGNAFIRPFSFLQELRT